MPTPRLGDRPARIIRPLTMRWSKPGTDVWHWSPPRARNWPSIWVIEPASLTAGRAGEPAAGRNLGRARTGSHRRHGGAPETAKPRRRPEAEEPPAELPATETGTLLRVTGDRVNFRAGPSTDDAILAALSTGTEVELIERVGDGWAHLRVLETDLSGYMSEDFLEPAN
jgi:hypothetical protein